MRLTALVAGFCCFVLGIAGASAGEIADLARSAEAKLQAGNHADAIADMQKALRLTHDQSPLALHGAVFVAEPPQGYGVYKPRANTVFKKDEPLVAYVEPLGMGWEKQPDGIFHALLVVDFEVRNPAGEILAGKRDFGRFEFKSREKNTEVMTHLTLKLGGAPPGNYIFGVVYHDKTTGKSANVDLPFEIK